MKKTGYFSIFRFVDCSIGVKHLSNWAIEHSREGTLGLETGLSNRINRIEAGDNPVDPVQESCLGNSNAQTPKCSNASLQSKNRKIEKSKNLYCAAAFTLVELLVVIGIIAVLTGASIGAYSKMTKTAERAKCQELVTNTATALTALFQKEGIWPRALRDGAQKGLLDERAAYPLRNYMSLSYDANSDSKTLTGLDKFGIVSPWAAAVIKSRGSSATISTPVSRGKDGLHTVEDHILHYAIDLDGDGIIPSVDVGGETIDVRATAIVWCAGKDGKLETYSRGPRMDDVYSWTKGQTQNVR